MRQAVVFVVKWALMFFIASIFVFFVVRMMPGSPAEQLLSAYQLPPTEENISALEEQWGLDQPLASQYFTWIGNFITGDWGRSLVSGLDIRTEFMNKLPYSLTIGLGGLISGAVLAFFLGFESAYRSNGFCDKFTRFLSIFAQTIPSFVLSILVIYWLGVELKLVRFFTGGSMAGLLIATAFSCLYCVGGLSRVVRTHYREKMKETYVKFSISRGFQKKYVLMRHTSKPVLYGLMSVLISRLAWIVGGSSVLEFAFGIPGVSYFLVDSMRAKDYFVLQSYVMVIMIWMFTMNLVFQLIMRALNPGGGK